MPLPQSSLARPAASICAGGGFATAGTGVSQQFDLGVHYFLREEYDRASRAFREVLREDPRNSRAWSYYGMAEAHLGHGGESESALSKALEIAPANAQAWFHLGVARSLRDEWPEAVSAYRHAVALAPSDLIAWHRLGVALAESGDETGATAAFERALVLSRETDDQSLPEAVRPEAEDDHLTESGEREGSREAKSWLDLALSLLSLGDEEEAVVAYERAYTLDPQRASSSLFRPMLRLVTAAQGRPLDDEPAEPVEPDPMRRPRRPFPPDLDAERPEVG